MDPFNEPTEDGEEDMFDAMPDDGVSRSKRKRERVRSAAAACMDRVR